MLYIRKDLSIMQEKDMFRYIRTSYRLEFVRSMRHKIIRGLFYTVDNLLDVFFGAPIMFATTPSRVSLLYDPSENFSGPLFSATSGRPDSRSAEPQRESSPTLGTPLDAMLKIFDLALGGKIGRIIEPTPPKEPTPQNPSKHSGPRYAMRPDGSQIIFENDKARDDYQEELDLYEKGKVQARKDAVEEVMGHMNDLLALSKMVRYRPAEITPESPFPPPNPDQRIA